MKILAGGLLTVLIFCIGLGLGLWWDKNAEKTVVQTQIVKERPLEKYTIENLILRSYDSAIVMDEQVSPGVYKFHFDSDGKKVTGLAHIPNDCVEKCPVIAQFRGYADRNVYYAGYGTEHSAQYFAKNGFISLAPDFLGYGDSASASANLWEERFQTYTTAINLMESIEKWNKTSPGKIGIWGHSNGGQITLTVLEIAGFNYPTVLWAPVSAPFPYSILYYTDDNDDHGKLLRREVAKFEQDYDAEKYTLVNYIDRIKAPILLQQGTADDQVPKKWSDNLMKKLKSLEIKVVYEVYPGADHDLGLGWDEAVKKDVDFYRENW